MIVFCEQIWRIAPSCFLSQKKKSNFIYLFLSFFSQSVLLFYLFLYDNTWRKISLTCEDIHLYCRYNSMTTLLFLKWLFKMSSCILFQVTTESYLFVNIFDIVLLSLPRCLANTFHSLFILPCYESFPYQTILFMLF